MDTRYRDRGYSAAFSETEYGAYLDIKRNDKTLVSIGVGFFEGGSDAKAQILIKRFKPDELRKVIQVDEFEDGPDAE